MTGAARTLVTVEVSQILEELVSVAYQNINDGASLVWVSNKHLQASYIECTSAGPQAAPRLSASQWTAET